MDIWDPTRLSIIGSILSRYGTHIAPGHRIRQGMEGDPCSPYRSAADAPSGTVLDVHREPSGLVRFRAEMDGTGEVVDLNNRDVSPDRIWEIDPAYEDTFRAAIGLPRAEEEQEMDAAATAHPRDDADAEYRSAMNNQLSVLNDRVSTVERHYRDVRDMLASTVRELSGDLVRAARGEAVEFAHRYVDRYDLARAADARSSPDETDDDAFRAAERDARARRQRTKYDFDDEVTALGYKGDATDFSEASVSTK